ncbi:type II toxin-antitoxin system RelE/ParE family toxin [Geminocystis sp. GBBB08]|uniref:type II toxin-antitoxin system RelE/ParE family toxin n=1 Tax=Geminocystis sp. GBBB08 TaxID=2604140 RepID=UPI0027E22A02|nr:type II toxin-antitoxin system RelE/ParE family toxin [Geminocystis sp. GBBB08]MBL1211601.1 type II toxin-antitoxin system RelE/ParE family toxin [Geminocystis sp. GBBB08]
MKVQRKEIRRYRTKDGKVPFAKWFDSLKDRKTQLKINERLRRVSLGNLGDYKSIGEGIFELRIDYGAGYRIYFAQEGNQIIVLLCGGDKSSQKKDILQAKEYWYDYKNR